MFNAQYERNEASTLCEYMQKNSPEIENITEPCLTSGRSFTTPYPASKNSKHDSGECDTEQLHTK